MPFTRSHGIARLLVEVTDVEEVSEFLWWFCDGRNYDLTIQSESTAVEAARDESKGGSDKPDGGDGHLGDSMDHDHSGDHSSSTNRTSQSCEVSVSKETTPTSTPMTGLPFSSFGATSAPGPL